MQPIVDGFKEMYGDQITFVYLNAKDEGEGQALFEQLNLPGHPAFLIFKDGQESFRAFGLIDEDLLEGALQGVLP
ncbi:hypothetical protein MASR2M15_00760 [Anaerolineales bacterium]